MVPLAMNAYCGAEIHVNCGAEIHAPYSKEVLVRVLKENHEALFQDLALLVCLLAHRHDISLSVCLATWYLNSTSHDYVKYIDSGPRVIPVRQWIRHEPDPEPESDQVLDRLVAEGVRRVLVHLEELHVLVEKARKKRSRPTLYQKDAYLAFAGAGMVKISCYLYRKPTAHEIMEILAANSSY